MKTLKTLKLQDPAELFVQPDEVANGTYYRLDKNGPYFIMETITVVNGKVTELKKAERNVIATAFGNIRRAILGGHYK